ncbi:CHAT domain-containing protein [Streptomyces sp. NPDC054863]
MTLWWEVAAVFGVGVAAASWLVGDRAVEPWQRWSGTFAGILLFGNSLGHLKGDQLDSWFLPACVALIIVWQLAAAVRGCFDRRRMQRDSEYSPHIASTLAADGRWQAGVYEQRGDLKDLDAVIGKFTHAVRKSRGHSHHFNHVANLVGALRARYGHTLQTVDLDRAIETGHDAATRISVKDPYRARLLSELSMALRVRYERDGECADLQAALETGSLALSIIPSRHVDRVACLRSLSAAWAAQYERTESLDDLDKAVELQREAASRRRRGLRANAIDEANLCHRLVQRSSAGGSLIDLDDAVEAGRRAVRRIKKRPHLYSSAAHNLSLALKSRFERRGDPADLDEAVTFVESTLSRLPTEHPLRARALTVLASLTHRRFEEHGDHTDLEQALALAREAHDHPSADVATRLVNGLWWSQCAASEGENDEAVRAFESVIALLPLFAPPELPLIDQEFRLGRLSGVAAAAASCAVATGEPAKAVALLEDGRGIVLAHGLEARGKARSLRDEHPEIAAEYVRLMRSPGASLADRRSLLRRIRALHGFTDFAHALDWDDLTRMAAEGPVVYVNVSKYGSDAIMVTAEGVHSLPLDRKAVTPKAVADQIWLLQNGLSALRTAKGEAEVDQVLVWLWTWIVQPVVRDLGLEPHGQGEPWQHIWWIPIGPMSLLPLHAAGHHSTRDTVEPLTLIDRAISSYAPTARALVEARQRPRPATQHVLVVALSRTPGARPLPAAGPEADIVRGCFPQALSFADAEATAERIQEALPASTWAHFACHGVTDPETSSRNRLLLHDHEQSPFDWRTISLLDLSKAHVAYLSACDTARTGIRLLDEAIHVASSFQLAGFSHVIATLWSTWDNTAVQFAQDFYTEVGSMARDPHTPVDVALAMHRATLAARSNYPNFPALWAGHVHFGA